MRKEERDIKAPQTQVAGLKIVFASIFMGASLLLDLYAMINYSELLWLIAIFSLVFVASVYFFSSSLMQLKFSAQLERNELYDDLFKSSKATYLMMKKSFEEIQQQLNEIEAKAGIPQEEILNTQKSIAKITISRNKENTDALMNSNDRLLEKIFDFEEQLGKMEERFITGQKSSTTEAIQEVLLKQQELSNLLKEVEITLKKDILSVNTKIQVQSQPMVMASAPISGHPYVPEPVVQPEMQPDFLEEPMIDIENDMAADEPLIEPEIGFDQELVEEPELPEEAEPELPEEPEIVAEPELPEEPEIVAEPELPEEPEIVVEPELPEEPEIVAEPELPEEPEIVAEPELPEEPEIPVEPEPVVEPVQEEKPPMPDLSDPNHVMTPDEIAALLANM